MSGPKLHDLASYEGLRKAVEYAVNVFGRENVIEEAEKYGKLVEERQAAYKLEPVNGENWFVRDDWMGFAGASRFPDGVNPVSLAFTVELDEDEAINPPDDAVDNGEPRPKFGSLEQTVLIVSADEDGESSKALCGFTLSNEVNYIAVLPSLNAAIALTRLARRCGSIKFSELKALGFSAC